MFDHLKKFAFRILDAANHDFCPSVNQYVYWIKQPIGWVVGAVVFSILIGVFVGPQGYVMAAAFTTLLVLGLVWPWLSMKAVRCSLSVPEDQLWEGQQFEVLFKVQNYWPMPVFGMMVKGNFLQGLDAGEEPIVFSLRRIPAWADTEFRIPVIARRRGLLPDGNVEIVNGFPFGLTEIAREVSVAKSGIVWPACESLQGQPKPIAGIQNFLGSLCDRSGSDGDTIGVRTWQVGDRLKNIHWAQSARWQRLMVRERQTLASSTVWVIVDLSPEHHVGNGVQSSYEWAIRLAGSVCWKLHQSRSDIQVLLLGLDLPDRQCCDNRLGIGPLMDSLAGLPTLSQVGPDAGSVRQNYVANSPNDSAFLIGTSRSGPCSALNLKKILIDLEGFGGDDRLLPNDDAGRNLETQSNMWVTAPSLAAVELKNHWSRSFSNASN
jgi:hypothetical protein